MGWLFKYNHMLETLGADPHHRSFESIGVFFIRRHWPGNDKLMKTLIVILLISLALPTHAESDFKSLGVWYTHLNGDSRSMRTDSIRIFAIAVDSSAYGMAVGFNEPLDGKMADARYQLLLSCFGSANREDSADAFANWAYVNELRADMPLGAAITLFLMELCEATDKSLGKT